MSDRIEVLATVLLGLAALATAWSSYQATRWQGEQAKAASQTNALRVDAARAQGLAEADGDRFDHVHAVGGRLRAGRRGTGVVLPRPLPDEFKPAVEAWIATRPLKTPAAPLSPFAMPNYRLAATADARRLDAEAQASAATVERDIQRASNYVLGVVLFAVALFFAGMTTKLNSHRLRLVVLSIGYVVFAATAIWMATSPVSISV